jgi:hypothetical protein
MKDKDVSRRNKFAKPVLIATISANIVFFLICLFDLSTGLYYITVVIIQIINAFFLAGFVVNYAIPITTGIQLVVLKVFVYFGVISSVFSLYLCFDNIYMVWACLLITSVLLIISYLLYNEHLKNTIQRKVLKRRSTLRH